jgi:predicted MFS family arabinose efflux permease
MLNVFPVVHVMAILMMVVMTFGEILSLPFMNTFWISRSREHNRGQYAALYTIAWSVAQTFGPALGALLAEHSGFNALWWVGGILCFVTAIGFAILHRVISNIK